ncbi:hypothetical protein FS749_009005 [Ceratobasidium sp. UAMH 11750]|nr:hypothetical protein FS749_009005 [Ceratobasidium sp. UAMH 11750]
MIHPTVNQIASAVIEGIEEGGEFDDNTILSLHYVFHHTLLAALDLIDRNRVLRVVHQRREYFQVHGTDEVYSVHMNLADMCGDAAEQIVDYDGQGLNWSVPNGWCSCPTFVATVVMAMEQPMCKHLLAVLLSRKLGKLPPVVRSNQEIGLALLDDNLSR